MNQRTETFLFSSLLSFFSSGKIKNAVTSGRPEVSAGVDF